MKMELVTKSYPPLIKYILTISIIFSFPLFTFSHSLAEETAQGNDLLGSRDVKIDELIDIALEQNPDIQEARLKWEGAKKRILQSWALPDPVAGIDFVGEETQTRVGPQDSRISFSGPAGADRSC